jgi:hypothetical protein
MYCTVFLQKFCIGNKSPLVWMDNKILIIMLVDIDIVLVVCD